MGRFCKCLFLSHGLGDDSEALELALLIARREGSPLDVLVMHPVLPAELDDYKELYETSLRESVSGRLGVEAAQGINVTVASASVPGHASIRHVLHGGYDLLVKAAQPRLSDTGFRAIDMELLRKCPVPVWIHREGHTPGSIAVAVNPRSEESEGKELALQLLQVAAQFAESARTRLTIVSCWDYPFEKTLSFAFGSGTDRTTALDVVSNEQRQHRAALDQLISASELAGDPIVCHLRGAPEERIPQLVQEKGIDLLVMGTVGRTGISGFLFGNTAEDVLQRVNCSLLALKPAGFRSPVRV
jgi:universal stress protein E